MMHPCFAGVGVRLYIGVLHTIAITGLIALNDLEGASGFSATGVSAELASIT